MLTGLWGKKIGMTQIFVKDKVVPVTVIDVAHWLVTQIKTVNNDGYAAVQIGHVRPCYQDQTFSSEWLKKLNMYFGIIREIHIKDLPEGLEVGQPIQLEEMMKEGDTVQVTGKTIGRGFAGVIKRHGFGGPPGSHGSTMGNRTGSVGFMRSQGKIIKGKRMPGHMGVKKRTVQGLQVIQVKPESHVMLINGSVPGKAGSLLFIRKV